VPRVQRVLDLDLDFFVKDVVYLPDQTTRPDPEWYSAWSDEEALGFLRGRCGLQEPLPGFVTENHGDLFYEWRTAIAAGLLVPPFHVTHVDAHADLGLGDAGYLYLLNELLLVSPEERTDPPRDNLGLTDGNHLAYAVACRWIAELDYVYCPGGGSDELHLVMQNHDRDADFIQLSPMTAEEHRELHLPADPVVLEEPEPPVPYRSFPAEDYTADGRFDFVCLTRSPPYTPETADRLFELICDEFIDAITSSNR
jgi:hypothetical protein